MRSFGEVTWDHVFRMKCIHQTLIVHLASQENLSTEKGDLDISEQKQTARSKLVTLPKNRTIEK